MSSVWQPKLKKHIQKYHYDVVCKEGPAAVLNRVIWRSKAGQRRIHPTVVQRIVELEMSNQPLSRDSLMNVATNILKRALVKVDDDGKF